MKIIEKLHDQYTELALAGHELGNAWNSVHPESECKVYLDSGLEI